MDQELHRIQQVSESDALWAG